MKDIKTIVTFLDKAKIDKSELFTSDDFQGSKSKMAKIFNLIKENNFHDKKELEKAMYGKVLDDWGFKKLFYRFKDKLTNTLFFADTSSPLFSERTKAYYICSRRAFLSRMLVERGARDMAIELAEGTISVTLKYEFTDITVLLSRFLIKQFSIIQPDARRFIKYFEIFKKNSQILKDEIEMEEIMCIYSLNAHTKDVKKHLTNYLRESETIVSRTQELSQNEPSIELILSCSSILLEHYKISKDYRSFQLWSVYFADKILSKQFLSVVTLEVLVHTQLRMALISKDDKIAKILFEKYFSFQNVGNYNWFVSYYYFIMIMFHSKEYEVGYHNLIFITEYKTFRNQSLTIRLYFYMLLAYAHFLKLIKKLEDDASNKQFRLSKFLNEVPEFTRDKQGTNIPIILVQILFFLADKKYNKIIDRIESLNLYSYRHLKKDENFRSQCFIRMISEMVRADFRKTGTIFRTEKLFNKLQAVPIETYPNSAATEIIPYEDLWAMIVERLD